MQGNGSSGQGLNRRAFVTGEWTAEPSRNLLVRGTEQVRVEPRVMDVLVHLSGRAGEVVSKEDLVAAVWEGRYVTDDVLTVTVYALRKALGDDARQPQYIETVSRRGYRWIAPVHANGSMAVTESAAQSRRTVTLIFAAAAALALAAGGAIWLFTSQGRRHVPAAAAHEAYVKGRYFLDQRSVSSLQQALEQFERAIALDPQYPAAHAGLADTYSSLSDFGVATPAELRPRAMTAAGHALKLDARSGEALAALGRAQFLFDWDFASAEKSIERAVELNPEHMPAFQVLAWLRSAQGRNEEAATAARRALQLDPVNMARYTELAWVLSFDGKFDAALAELDRALRLNPRHFECHMMKGWTLELAGKPDAAFAAYREGLVAAATPKESLQRVDAVYHAEGLPGYYKLWLNRSSSGSRPLSDTWLAQIYVRTGELDRAIAALEQAFQKRESALAWVNVDPSFRLLRADERFQRIAGRVGHD